MNEICKKQKVGHPQHPILDNRTYLRHISKYLISIDFEIGYMNRENLKIFISKYRQYLTITQNSIKYSLNSLVSLTKNSVKLISENKQYSFSLINFKWLLSSSKTDAMECDQFQLFINHGTTNLLFANKNINGIIEGDSKFVAINIDYFQTFNNSYLHYKSGKNYKFRNKNHFSTKIFTTLSNPTLSDVVKFKYPVNMANLTYNNKSVSFDNISNDYKWNIINNIIGICIRLKKHNSIINSFSSLPLNYNKQLITTQIIDFLKQHVNYLTNNPKDIYQDYNYNEKNVEELLSKYKSIVVDKQSNICKFSINKIFFLLFFNIIKKDFTLIDYLPKINKLKLNNIYYVLNTLKNSIHLYRQNKNIQQDILFTKIYKNYKRAIKHVKHSMYVKNFYDIIYKKFIKKLDDYMVQLFMHVYTHVYKSIYNINTSNFTIHKLQLKIKVFIKKTINEIDDFYINNINNEINIKKNRINKDKLMDECFDSVYLELTFGKCNARIKQILCDEYEDQFAKKVSQKYKYYYTLYKKEYDISVKLKKNVEILLKL